MSSHGTDPTATRGRSTSPPRPQKARTDSPRPQGARTGTARSRGALLVVAAALCWSSGGLLARMVDTDTWTTVFWRGVFSAITLLGLGVVRARRSGAGGLFSTLGWPGLLMAAGFATASTCFI